ncbi:hypothetical protein [Tumebacillus permanentifrigoris]|uniref:hypothetical protein n=1 Tax=Tumebacillus permanentifrigoris TaxID=378543 RepID=UPI000D6AECFF|nr:hypothetical protein [Tumebacillus permanentifrigoris]
MKKKVLLGTASGYLIALVTSPFLPEVYSLLIPFIGMAVGTVLQKRALAAPNIQESVPDPQPAAPTPSAAPVPPLAPQPMDTVIDPEFAPVMEYLSVLEDMVISEGQKSNLDDEIVDRSLALFSRIQHVVPLLQELNNGDLNHTVRRLVLKDLNGFITPFLRLSGENKSKNRRTLLNGLKDINSKLTTILERVEHKDLLELQTKADLIHRRYNDTEGY